MKKYLYIALAAATLASCSQDESLDIQKEAISFGEAFVGKATRAATDPSYTATTLKAIKVWGAVTGTDGAVEVFKNNNVTGTVGEKSEWTCTDRTQYWIPNAKYNFAAVVDGTVTDTDLGTDLLPATISYTASTQKDLLYAKSTEYTGKTTGNDLVKFEFAHLLSKVKFTAVNTTTDTKYTFDITGLTITNSATSGTVAVPAKTWTVATGDGSDTPIVFGAIEGVTYQTTPAEGQTATVYECATEKFLIPENFTAWNITFNLVWYYNGKQVATESNLGGSVAVNLQPGNAYNFVISKGLKTPIQFTVETLPTWTIQSNQNVTVQ